MKKIQLTNANIVERCAVVAAELPADKLFYGVPRGGIAPAYLISALAKGYVTDNPKIAHYIIDDLVDSGATMIRYLEKYPKAEFISLYDHADKPKKEWMIFPWERTEAGNDESATDIFTRLLEYIGEDPTREGLLDTPKRMLKMYEEVTAGYSQDPADYFKTFQEDAADYDEMIILDPIPFFSLCEHHLAPFFGDVYIGYIPDKQFAGLSKLARVVDTFSRRLQIQERLTHEIAKCIEDHVHPLGVAIVIKARHLCMEMRGVKTHNVFTTTSALKGVMMTDTKARNEFLQLIK